MTDDEPDEWPACGWSRWCDNVAVEMVTVELPGEMIEVGRCERCRDREEFRKLARSRTCTPIDTGT